MLFPLQSCASLVNYVGARKVRGAKQLYGNKLTSKGLVGAPGKKEKLAKSSKAFCRRSYVLPSLGGRKNLMVTSESGMTIQYNEVKVATLNGISLHDLTEDINKLVTNSGVKNGVVNVLSRHTTTAVTINENEARLVDDVRQYLVKLAPPDHPYLHNDLHLRHGPPDWPGGDEAWRDQEPINAHSHILSMLLGSSESIPIVDGKIMIGTWQSVMLVELDGPRERKVGIQVMGQ